MTLPFTQISFRKYPGLRVRKSLQSAVKPSIVNLSKSQVCHAKNVVRVSSLGSPPECVCAQQCVNVHMGVRGEGGRGRVWWPRGTLPLRLRLRLWESSDSGVRLLAPTSELRSSATSTESGIRLRTPDSEICHSDLDTSAL